MRISDAISAHPSGIRKEHRDERARTREGKLPDDNKREALAAAVPNSGADKGTTQPGFLTLGALGGRESTTHIVHVDVCRRHRLDAERSAAAFVFNLPHDGLGGSISNFGKPDFGLT